MSNFNINSPISFHPLPLLQVHRPSDDRTASHAHSPSLELEPRRSAASTAVDSTTPLANENDPTVRSRSIPVSDDLENQNERYTGVTDPYDLKSKLKTPTEIEALRPKPTRQDSLTAPARDAVKARRLKNFYTGQNENILRLLKPVSEHRRQAKAENDQNALQFKIAVNGSFAANVILAVLQVYGAVSSASLSLFTTMADALFDPLSNVTLILSARAVNSVDPRRFPSGKARIENAGNIVFCFLMCSVSFILIAVSALEIAAGSESETKGFHLPSVIAVAVAFCTKLALFCYCWSLRNKYSQIRILWEDHRNDLLINGFGLLTSVGGSKLKWWIDPMGAIILSVLIAGLWLLTAYKEFLLLIGISADTEMLQLITYICKCTLKVLSRKLLTRIAMTHSPEVRAIDTVRAFHSGPRLIVEVDVVMDAEETLRKTHDIAEELQMKLESLPKVDRAYVHVDYETSHAPEHFLKKEL